MNARIVIEQILNNFDLHENMKENTNSQFARFKLLCRTAGIFFVDNQVCKATFPCI